mgnify:CR=1 FL=1
MFAEPQVISMIAGQQNRDNIIAGIHESAAARVAILATKIKLKELRKLINNNLMIARYEDRIELDVIENYMERFKKWKKSSLR